jgi:hypothetical protein
MSSFHHRQLDYSHSRYIAPLMANFDTIGNDSATQVLIVDNKFMYKIPAIKTTQVLIMDNKLM